MFQKILNFGRLGPVRNAVAPKCNILMATKRNKIVAAPPAGKISKGEALFLQLSFTVSIMIIPIWVCLNLKNYSNPKA